MKYYVVISPNKLISKILKESKKIQSQVYGQEGNEIYFRVKTGEKRDNPRRMFLKGDGRIVKAQVKPHISLVHNAEPKEQKLEEFFNEIDKIAGGFKKFYLEPDGIGNYNQDFTFFLRFKNNDKIVDLRSKILEASRKYLTEEEYRRYISVSFVPHITILYDDIDPEKVKKAQSLLNISQFKDPVLVDNVQIWEAAVTDQKVVKQINLGG